MNIALIYLLCLYTINVQLHNVQLELEEANSQLASDKSATVVNLSTELQAKKRVVINLRSELESVRKDLLRTEEILKKKKDTELSNDNVLVKNLRSELQSVRKDLLKTEEMLKKKDTELSNDNKTTVLVEHLRKELEVAKAESALLEERLDSSKLSNWNSLVEVATNREQVRNLKEDLEEVMEEKVNGDHQEIIDVDDGKRDMDDEVKDSPRKRQKTRTDDDDDDSDVVVDNDADNDDDDDSDDDDDDDDIIL
jgi:chromosome segregation ATPase